MLANNDEIKRQTAVKQAALLVLFKGFPDGIARLGWRHGDDDFSSLGEIFFLCDGFGYGKESLANRTNGKGLGELLLRERKVLFATV